MNKRISLELVINDEQENPVVSEYFVAYYPYRLGTILRTTPPRKGHYREAPSYEYEDIPLSILLTDDGLSTNEKIKVNDAEKALIHIGKVVQFLSRDQEELVRRYAYNSYVTNFVSISLLLNGNNEENLNLVNIDKQIAGLRFRYSEQDLIDYRDIDGALMMFYMAKHNASLCNQPFPIKREEVEEAVSAVYRGTALKCMDKIEKQLKAGSGDTKWFAEMFSIVTEKGLKGQLDMNEIEDWRAKMLKLMK